MKQKIAFTMILLAIVGLVVWFVPGTAETVEDVVLDLLVAIGY